MARRCESKVLHVLYLIGIWFKGIDGVLELAGGVIFLVASQATLYWWIADLTQHELWAHPNDWVTAHLRHAATHLSSDTRVFAGAYLVGHGAIKVFLVCGGLLRKKMWAFPASLVLLGAFVAYQGSRLIYRFSLGLLVLMIIDLAVLLLIWREYRLAKHGGANALVGQ